MRKLRFGTNFAVFLLFFGLATLEALQTSNWIIVGFWEVIGCVFLYMDSTHESRQDS
jgi:hypothetical protein